MKKILIMGLALFALFNTGCVTKNAKWDNLFDSQDWQSINTRQDNAK
nr:hypothetical protein [uncultured Campylobacter sp.]